MSDLYTTAMQTIHTLEDRVRLINETPWYMRMWCAMRGHGDRQELCASFMCVRCGHRAWKWRSG